MLKMHRNLEIYDVSLNLVCANLTYIVIENPLQINYQRFQKEEGGMPAGYCCNTL